MIDSAAVTSSLARVVSLFRLEPEERDTQKAAFRALLVRMGGQDLALQATDSTLVINGTPVPPGAMGDKELRRVLLGHGIGELFIPGTLAPGQLLQLLRTIASPPGTYAHLQQLRDALAEHAVAGVRVAPPMPSGPANAPKPEEGALAALGPGAASEDAVGLLHFVTLEMPSAGRLADLLATLEQDPDSAEVSELLNEVVGFGEMASQREQWVEVLQAASALVRLEGLAGEESARRGYHIALRRLMSRSALDQVVRMTASGTQKTEAITVLRRIGAEGTELLLNALVSARELGERRAYYSALSQMREGTDLLVHMLGHDEWFVVRNVAYLCGELELESAVPALGELTRHADDRVRRAAAAALGRIGTAATIEPLRRLLTDGTAIVRLDAAMAIDGQKGRPLVPALRELIPQEPELDVQREMLAALARIGTPEAIDGIAASAAAGRGLFHRKAVGLRLAAIAALRQAGPAGDRVLREFTEDKDTQVREAAQQALDSR